MASTKSRAMLLMMFVVGLVLATEAMAQDGEFTEAMPAPAPATMDAGAAFFVTYSPAFVCSSLLLSLLSIPSH